MVAPTTENPIFGNGCHQLQTQAFTADQTIQRSHNGSNVVPASPSLANMSLNHNFKQNAAPLHQMQTNTNSTNAMHTRENQNHSRASSQNAAFAGEFPPQSQTVQHNPCSNTSQNCYPSNVNSYKTSSVQPIASVASNNFIQNTVSSNQMPIDTNSTNKMQNICNQNHYGARFQNPVPSSQLTPQSQNLQNNHNSVPSNQMPIMTSSTNTMHTRNNQNITDAPFQNAAFAGHLTPQSQTACSQNYYVSNVNFHNDSGNEGQVGNNETQQKNLEEFESALEFMDGMDEKDKTPGEQKMEKERVAKITQWLMNDTDTPGWMPSNLSSSIADNPMTSRTNFIPGGYGHTDQTNNEETPKISDINYEPVEAKGPRFDDSLTKTDRYVDTDYHATNEVIVGYFEKGGVHGPVGSPIETFSPIVQNQNTTSSNQNHVPASQLTPQSQYPQNTQCGNQPLFNASQNSQASQIDFTTTSLGSLENIFDQLNSPLSNTSEDQYCSTQQHYNFPKISDSHNSSNVTDTAPTSTNALPNHDAMGDTETDLATEFDKMFPYNGSEQMNNENDLDYYHEQFFSSDELGNFDRKPESGLVYVEQTSSVTLHAQSFQQNIHDTGDYHAVNNNVSTGFEPTANAVVAQTQPACKNSPSLRDMLGKKEILKTLSKDERSEIAQLLFERGEIVEINERSDAGYDQENEYHCDMCHLFPKKDGSIQVRTFNSLDQKYRHHRRHLNWPTHTCKPCQEGFYKKNHYDDPMEKYHPNDPNRTPPKPQKNKRKIKKDQNDQTKRRRLQN